MNMNATPSDSSAFADMLLPSLECQWERFSYYRHLCGRQGVALDDLRAFVRAGDYSRVPSVASPAFKRSKGLLRELNDFSAPGDLQVSSSTSGDPSYVLTSPEELERVKDQYRRTFGVAGVSTGLGFAPSARILSAMSKMAAFPGLRRKTVGRMHLAMEGGASHYRDFHITVDVNVARTLVNRALGKPASLRKMPASEVAAIVRAAERDGRPIAVGGVSLLLRPYLEELGDGAFHLGSRGFVTFSGGGYSGAKGSIRGEKIDKPSFIAKIGAVFGIEPGLWATHVKDIYGFTETPALFEGYWDLSRNEFLFRAGASNPEAKIYIVDPETERPLRAGRGLVKVIAPAAAGRPASANVCVLQFDEAEVVSTAGDGSAEAFCRVSRLQGVAAEGCAFKAAEIGGSV
jgi:hypothetical protein